MYDRFVLTCAPRYNAEQCSLLLGMINMPLLQSRPTTPTQPRVG